MISEKQLKVLSFGYSKYDALICDGAIRTGKSSMMMLGFVHWAMTHFNNQTFAICGKTVTSVFRNVIAPFQQLAHVKDRYVTSYARSANKLVVKRGDVTNTFYVYGGKDESSYMLIQGITLAGVLLDEVVLMVRSFVNQAIARCSVEGSKIWFSCNPDSPEHWFYKEWILKPEKHNALYLHFELDDNPSLSEQKKKQYRSWYEGRFYEKYIEGKWVKAEGLVYSCFDKEKHVVEPQNIPADVYNGKLYISMDYGITNPFAALLIAIYDYEVWVLDEYYYTHEEHDGERLTDDEHMQNVDKLIGGRHIEPIVIDPSATSFKELIRRKTQYNYRNARNDVIPGISYTTTLFSVGSLHISSKCENLIRELGLYCWDEDAQKDAVIKENDHACDALRYFCYTIAKS